MTAAHTAAFTEDGGPRRAELRTDSAQLRALSAHPQAQILPIWRGKPLLVGGARLGWVGRAASVLRHAAPGQLFLGTDPVPRFAADVSRWEPPALDRAALAMFNDMSEQHFPGLPADHLFCDLRARMTDLPPPEATLAATARALFNWHRTHGFCAACGAASEMTMGGWQRDCPACGARHFPRTDPVVIMLVLRGNRLLLGRSPGWPEGMYSALAGFVEPGETIEAAVRREVAEETGITVGAVRYLSSQPWPFPSSLMIGCVAEALDMQITLDAELDDALWVSREEMVEAFAGVHPTIRAARPGSIARQMIGEWLSGRVTAAF